jgi:hypothetical protein
MRTLYREIGNALTDKDIPNITAAKFIDSTEQELSDFLNGKKGLGFRKILKFSYLLYEENQEKVMENWCLRLNTTESIKQCFEYASITRNKPLLKKLIDTYSSDKAFCNHIAIYSILYDFYMNYIKADDLIERLEDLGRVKGELSILTKIIECYNYYYIEEYHLMLATARQAQKLIKKLSNRHLFIKECYLHRIFEVLGHVSLQLNDLDSARYYALEIINANICAKTVSGSYYILGMTYLSENKTKCINYLQTRYEITKTLGEQDIEDNARRDLDFAKLYLNIPLDADSDSKLLRLQNNKGSEFELRLLKEAISEEIFQKDDYFVLLFIAIAKNSIKNMYECRRSFFDQSNYFFASLAAREAKKMGESSILIDELIEFKVKTKGDVEFEKNFIRCFTCSSDYRNSISA